MVWSFDVRPERVAEFERAYGPEGDWVRLFRRHQGYRGTELLNDAARPGRYLTIDRWRSRADAQNFRATFGAEYTALDEHCEVFTTSERLIGEFETKEQSRAGTE